MKKEKTYYEAMTDLRNAWIDLKNEVAKSIIFPIFDFIIYIKGKIKGKRKP